ncbi:MAG: glycerophosphodiester phosphodiesterase [Erythrobacter sp.]|uniref:glycerophosphodiester phosphodiesterase family protein n=1 Tax=Erythrobacter sp. TaxID=1042 RepID=UPI0025D5EADC|nr:glycerophosphodiester phosphodiesterase family protein [Erythrobacter sp.]MCM0000368.1 glycerophosphodiester phosphodiesterase [Erythrobacter sp.]
MVRSLALMALAVLSPVAASSQDSDMLVIAHRGASAERPEHTLAAYERAIDQGADYIEPDLVATKDLVLVARHENELSGTTDVATREEFEDRRRDKTIDGRVVAGWFSEDFTLAELRTLRAKERIPTIRPANARFDGLYQVPTLADIVKLVRAKEAETGRRVGIYPELKHPTFLLQNAGIDLVDLLLRDFRALGITASDPVFIQSFEVAPLQRLRTRAPGFRQVLLVEPLGGPADEPSLRYTEMVTPTGLAEVAKYADAVGAYAGMILTDEGEPTSLVADAHAAGLKVHAWTLRIENDFLPMRFRRPGEGGEGCYNKLFAALRKAGVDGVFTDSPKQIVAERKGVVWNGWCAPE